MRLPHRQSTPNRCLRQVSTDSSLTSSENLKDKLANRKSRHDNTISSVLVQQNQTPLPGFYGAEGCCRPLKEDKLKLNKNYQEKPQTKDIMRGSSLRNSGRPANSMEQDSFDSFDDMEDMLVVSATNSLNLNNPNDIRYYVFGRSFMWVPYIKLNW